MRSTRNSEGKRGTKQRRWGLCYQMLPNWERGCLQVVENLVDLAGIEPATSSMPWKRAPSCATGPLLWEGRCPESRHLKYFLLPAWLSQTCSLRTHDPWYSVFGCSLTGRVSTANHFG